MLPVPLMAELEAVTVKGPPAEVPAVKSPPVPMLPPPLTLQVKVGEAWRVQAPSGCVGEATRGGRAWVSMRMLKFSTCFFSSETSKTPPDGLDLRAQFLEGLGKIKCRGHGYDSSGSLLPVTLLVFLSRAAGAGVVASNLL